MAPLRPPMPKLIALVWTLMRTYQGTSNVSKAGNSFGHRVQKISGPHHLSVGNIERETKYSCVEMDHTRSGDASFGCRGRAQLTWQYPEGVSLEGVVIH
eukprot:scaffold8470_cov118-Skeletonema_menzelii.AAC.9